jgi:hypothetical protein
MLVVVVVVAAPIGTERTALASRLSVPVLVVVQAAVLVLVRFCRCLIVSIAAVR